MTPLTNDQIDRLAKMWRHMPPSESLRHVAARMHTPHPCRLHPGQIRDVDHLIAVQMEFYERFGETPPAHQDWLRSAKPHDAVE